MVRGNTHSSQQFASSKCDALLELLQVPQLTHGRSEPNTPYYDSCVHYMYCTLYNMYSACM